MMPGRIHIVLEYCKGGDLSMYIQRHGRVPEATAKHFMQQLVAGLQVLRETNLIHRDLKPQNLLLSTNDSNAVLKIADFGFARSLQPRGLAETLCGSPLYMAPEIMQLQKYDAKADLWSVGAILFQLVTGKTPYTGNNQIQLLQNIVKSTELQFPLDSSDLSSDCKDLCQKLLRRNPVERLTFEEFFNHPFLSNRKMDDPLRNTIFSKPVDSFPSSDNDSVRNTEENSQDDCLPFFLDDDSSGPESSPSFSNRQSRINSTYGFSLDTQVDGKEARSNVLNNMEFAPRYSSTRRNLEYSNFKPDNSKLSDENLYEGRKPLSTQRSMPVRPRVVDSLEFIDQDYVLVSGPPLEGSSSLTGSSKPSHIPYKSSSPPRASVIVNTVPVPINGNTNNNLYHIGSSESRISAPGTSQESMDVGDVLEHPSTHCVLTRIKSLQQCASTISELGREKVEAGRQLEAFSIQLIILAIWKQALHICHTQAASAIEGSPSKESSRLRRTNSDKHGTSVTEDSSDAVPGDISAQIEREFLREVEHAEELAKAVDPGNVEMPDAMETIFQAALALGRHGGVEELMGEMETASLLYIKAVRLLAFLLVEAPSLIVNPPFSLTNSDRYRLRSYIDILNNRQLNTRSQKTGASQM